MLTNTTLPIIQTAEGPVQGVLDHDVIAYKGIPYAAPPVVNLRWRPPQPVTPWTTTRRPTKEDAPACWQNRQQCIEVGGGDPYPMSEDCLYLNVWTPPPDAGAGRLPVMVWIHGGAYVLGAGRLPVYHGAPLVKRGAILVTLNYRLGALGFFAHPALEAERREGEPRVNNFGLLDQIAALEWVQRNIEKFGGDPDNVTIFGQSAGARSVLALFTSPLVTQREKPLFHRGIAQSVYRNPDATQAQAHARGAKLAGLLLGLADGSTATAEQLRGIEVRRLFNIDGEFTKDDLKGTSNSPVAITGDAVLPNEGGVIDSFLKGEAAPLPLIIGNTSDDGSVVLDIVPAGVIFDMAPEHKIRTVRYYYPDLAERQDAPALRPELGRRLARDAFFTVTTYKIAEAHGKRAPVWRYYFDYTAENHRATVPDGTRHGDDVAFTMNTLAFAPPFPPDSPENPLAVTATDEEVASRVSEYWFEFGRTGTPSSSTGPEWPKHAEGQDKTLLLGQFIEVRTDFMKQHFGETPMDNMSAFDEVGKVLDKFMD
jgi:para-nitrobenzyl esterase